MPTTPSETLSFVPGPSHVRPIVRERMAVQPLPHRSAAFRAVVGRVQANLGRLLRTDAPVVPLLGSGTTAIETVLRAVARRRVLALVGGAFAQRIANMSTALGLETETLTVPPGDVVAPEAVARALESGSFDTVTVVHSETSTGALSDVGGIAEVVAGHAGVALVVDAVSSIGAVDLAFDDLGPRAALVSVTGKALACPPGMSIVAVSAGAAERAGSAAEGDFALRLDSLLARHAKGDTPHTPNTPLFGALDLQLERILDEGVAVRAARHEEMAGLVRTFAEERLGVLAQEGARSPSVTAVENTTGLDCDALLGRMEERGFRLAAGYGALRGATFRVGHLGDLSVGETEQMLGALAEELERA